MQIIDSDASGERGGKASLTYFRQRVADLPNAELLTALDLVLLARDKRLLPYAHLQVVGVGEWTPKSTNPSWSDDPRVAGEE